MKFNSSKLLPYLIFLIIIFTIIGGAIYYQNRNSQKEITRYKFYGTEFQFRNDLRAAQTISLYPDYKSILDKVWDPNITKINIAYIPTAESSTENSMLSLSVIEIRFKLDIAYHEFNWANEFTGTELKSFDDINSTNDTLTIALVRPSLSDKTGVELHGNIVYIKGKTEKEFDLATTKFLMAALNITI